MNYQTLFYIMILVVFVVAMVMLMIIVYQKHKHDDSEHVHKTTVYDLENRIDRQRAEISRLTFKSEKLSQRVAKDAKIIRERNTIIGKMEKQIFEILQGKDVTPKTAIPQRVKS